MSSVEILTVKILHQNFKVNSYCYHPLHHLQSFYVYHVSCHSYDSWIGYYIHYHCPQVMFFEKNSYFLQVIFLDLIDKIIELWVCVMVVMHNWASLILWKVENYTGIYDTLWGNLASMNYSAGTWWQKYLHTFSAWETLMYITTNE